MFIARAMCGLTSSNSNCLVLRLESVMYFKTMTEQQNEAGRWRELSPLQFSCYCNYSLITRNKTPVHSTWGLLRVCAACSTPRLNQSSELRPSWNNIQDTFLTGSATNTKDMLPLDRITYNDVVFFFTEFSPKHNFS